MHEMMSDTNTTPFNIYVYILGDGLKKDFIYLTFFSWTSSVLHEPNYTNVVCTIHFLLPQDTYFINKPFSAFCP